MAEPSVTVIERNVCDHPTNYHVGVAPPAVHYSKQILPYRLFELAVMQAPSKVAVITDSGQQFTFEKIDEMTRQLASGLLALGIKQGEAVATFIGNRWEQLPLCLAAARLGALYMVGNRFLTRAEIQFQLDELRPGLLVGEAGYSIEEILSASTDDPAQPFANENAGAFIRFSSGTTGKPKMMVLTHRAAAAQMPIASSEMGLTDRDTQLVVGPLAHAALNFSLAQLFAGGTVVLREKFDKETLWQDCAKHHITNTMVVPTMLASAIEFPGDVPELRCVMSLGAPLAPSLKQRLLERFKHLRLFEMYGSTEIGMATCLRPADQLRKAKSVGRACVGSEVAIFDDEGAPVPAGEVGTIYVRSPGSIERFVGSVKPEPAPAHLTEEGWLTSGDLGRFDNEGFLYISDRRVDLILSGGLNVYPAEVEQLLMEVPGVRGAVVVGLPDEIWGQRVTAYVEGEAAEDTIRALVTERLARYKHPHKIIFVAELPRTSIGKLSRKIVRDAANDGTLPS